MFKSILPIDFITLDRKICKIEGNRKYKIVPLTPSILHTSNLNVFPMNSKFLKGEHTVQEWLEIKFYCLWLFSTFHIHTWWGQSKYVRKFEISRANFEKFKILYILKNFLWILCINMQNCSNSKELRQKSSKNLWTISKLVQEPLN